MDKQIVHAVTKGQYDEYMTVAVFLDKGEAQAFADSANEGRRFWEDEFEIEDWPVGEWTSGLSKNSPTRVWHIAKSIDPDAMNSELMWEPCKDAPYDFDELRMTDWRVSLYTSDLPLGKQRVQDKVAELRAVKD